MAALDYSYFQYAPENLALLQDSIAQFDAKGARVILFISPYHLLHKTVLSQTGQYPTFERWKRDLTRLVAQANTTSKQAIRLWDFSGYNQMTTEPLPAAPQTRMK